MKNEMLEKLVPEEGTENMEQTIEQSQPGAAETPKMYTEEELNAELKERLDKILPGRIERKEAQIRREYESTYGKLADVVRAGTGKEDLNEITDHLRQSFERGGRKMPQEPNYSEADLVKLAKMDADEIIQGGLDEVVAEMSRMMKGGDMSRRDKEVYKALADYRTGAEQDQELAKIGVPESVRRSKEFKAFAGQFQRSVSPADVYKLYEQTTKPKKEIEPAGSMRATPGSDGGLKDFYSYEEASKFTKKDFDKNPKLFERVRQSMLKW